MSNYKSKNLQTLVHTLENIDRDIASVKLFNSVQLLKINIDSGSDKKVDIAIYPDLQHPLAEFLLNYFNDQKEKTYEKMRVELKKP